MIYFTHHGERAQSVALAVSTASIRPLSRGASDHPSGGIAAHALPLFPVGGIGAKGVQHSRELLRSPTSGGLQVAKRVGLPIFSLLLGNMSNKKDTLLHIKVVKQMPCSLQRCHMFVTQIITHL